VDASTFNWSVVIFVGVMIATAITYAVKGRHVYVGPVTTVEGRYDL
jgi:choline transport protein